MSSTYRRLKHVVFGRPLPSERLEHERLNKKTALAVLSSDAISSVAYATDQILFVLGGAIGTRRGQLRPADLGGHRRPARARRALVSPDDVRVPERRRLVHRREERTSGAMPGLVAAAALLTDYILTVAVSISGGVAAITSAYPALAPHTVLLCVAVDRAARDGESARRARVGRGVQLPTYSSS